MKKQGRISRPSLVRHEPTSEQPMPMGQKGNSWAGTTQSGGYSISRLESREMPKDGYPCKATGGRLTPWEASTQVRNHLSRSAGLERLPGLPGVSRPGDLSLPCCVSRDEITPTDLPAWIQLQTCVYVKSVKSSIVPPHGSRVPGSAFGTEFHAGIVDHPAKLRRPGCSPVRPGG